MSYFTRPISTALLLPLMLMSLLAPARADSTPEIDALFEALQMQELMEIMSQEGRDYGSRIESDLFPGRGGSAWETTVGEIYDANRMYDGLASRLAAKGDIDGISVVTEFFQSDLGQQIAELEVTARRAFLDDEIEDAAKQRFVESQRANSNEVDLVNDYIAANDIIDSNVMGTMNSSLGFYQGLVSGNAFETPRDENDILSDIWSQEPQIREETTLWAYSYFLMVFDPLEEDQVRDYIELSESPAGQALNRAMFDAYDGMQQDMSRRLGFAAAGFMIGQDI